MSIPRIGLLGKNTLYFLLSLGVALGLQHFLSDPSFNDSQNYVLFLLFFCIGLWLTEAIPAFAVALFTMAFLGFALGDARFNSEPQNIRKYIDTFSSSVIWLMLGGFFLGEAMTKTKLDFDLLRFALKISGKAPKRILLGMMLTTMLISTIMSNTATTAMMIAATMPLLRLLGKNSSLAKGLLVGIPLAATVGGMATIIGTPPNAIAAGALENAGIQMDFMTWVYYGAPLVLILIVVGYFTVRLAFLKKDEAVSLDFLEEQKEAFPKELRKQRLIVLIIIMVTVGFWLTSSIHHLSVSAVSAIPIVFLTMLGIITGSDVRKMPWDTLLLVAGGLSLGLALEETGLLDHYAKLITQLKVPHIVFICILGYATMVVSNVMSGTAASTVLIPLGMAILVSSRTEIAVIIGLAASTSMLLPISSPANAIAYSTGLIEQKDFRVGGIVMGLLGPALIILWVMLLA